MQNLLIILLSLSAFSAKADFTVLVIDTGLSKERTELTKYVSEEVKYKYNDTHELGHGTHITAIILEHACPGVKIIPCSFWSETSEVDTLTKELNCLKKGLKFDINIVNMSLSGLSHSKMEEKLLKIYEIKKIPVITALGNDDLYLKQEKGKKDVGSYPADLKLNNIVRIGALRDMKFSEKTNFASNVLYLEGDKWAAGKEAGTKTFMRGTSQAAAYYTGLQVKKYCEEAKKELDFARSLSNN